MKNILLTILLLCNFCIYAQVYDYEGNKYDTVRIGKQVWLKQNIRSKLYADGTPVTRSYHIYNDSLPLLRQYGYLYTYLGAIRDSINNPEKPLQGICPNGFHIPFYYEFIELVFAAGGLYVPPAYRLKDSILWNGNDSTGFSLLPGGIFVPGYGFRGLNEYTYLVIIGQRIYFNNNGVISYRNPLDANVETSCRCIMDQPTGMQVANNPAVLALEAFPNPTTGLLHFNHNIEFANAMLYFYNIFGQQVYCCPFQNQIDISQLPAGLYMLHIITKSNKSYVTKVVRE
jgi:uncharacterized protein (TIGR02145 family)